MALIRHLGKRCLFATKLHQQMLKNSLPMATSSPSPYRDMEEYWDKNERLGRPLSPHLSIYAKQTTSMLSLIHRATGIAMAISVSTVAAALLVIPGSWPDYIEFVRNLHLHPALLASAKFFVGWPMVYHYINGIRHLAWDAGKGYDLDTLYKTGYTALTLSVIVTAACVALI